MFLTITILTILLLILQAHNNVILNYVQPSCNYSLPYPHQGCLRGQTCLQDNSCEKNYGPGIRARQFTANSRPDGRFGPDSDDASCGSVSSTFGCSDEANAIGASPQQSYGTTTSTGSFNITSFTGFSTFFTTTPKTPNETTSYTTYTEYTTVLATTYSSSSASVWLLLTICFDTPTLCGTGPYPWTEHPHSPFPPTTNVPRNISPAAPTARLEVPERGGLDPPNLRLRAAPAPTENMNPTEPASAHPITLTALPTPRKVLLPKDALATETLSTNSDSQEKKLIKPQPQTARMAATGAAGLDSPPAGGSDNGHPAWEVVVESGSSIAVITPVPSGVAERGAIVEPRDDDDGEESRAAPTYRSAESSTVVSMATVLLIAVVLVVGL